MILRVSRTSTLCMARTLIFSTGVWSTVNSCPNRSENLEHKLISLWIKFWQPSNLISSVVCIIYIEFWIRQEDRWHVWNFDLALHLLLLVKIWSDSAVTNKCYHRSFSRYASPSPSRYLSLMRPCQYFFFTCMQQCASLLLENTINRVKRVQ